MELYCVYHHDDNPDIDDHIVKKVMACTGVEAIQKAGKDPNEICPTCDSFMWCVAAADFLENTKC